MIKLALLLILLLIINYNCCSSKPLNEHGYLVGKNLSLKPRDVPLEMSGGWYSFQFQAANTIAPSHFVFELKAPALIKITDYFCSGDRFFLRDLHTSLGPTSNVPFDECLTNSTNPDYTFGLPAKFSSGSFRLEVGWHNISVRVLVAPYGGGSAAVRLDPIILQCALKNADSHAFTVVDTAVPALQAPQICGSLGLQLADINLKNTLAAASDISFQCLGSFRKVWIKSFYGEDYQNSCLALRTLVVAPGGQVGIEEDCEALLPVLCANY